jgi:hypothetical protein
VEDRLAGTRVAHRRRIDAQDHAVVGVVALHEDLVAAHPHVGGDVALLRLADDRVQEQPVRDLQGGLGQVLVRAVDRVARLEGDDAAPAALLERLARLGGGEQALRERLLVVGQRLGLDRAGQAAVPLPVDRGDAGVGVVGCPVDLLRLALDVAVEDLFDGESPEPFAVVGGDLDHVSLRRLQVGREHDRNRPDPAVGETHLVDHGAPVVGAHKPAERREAAVREQLEVGCLAGGEGEAQGLLGGGAGHAQIAGEAG